jgi:hypothetical protein
MTEVSETTKKPRKPRMKRTMASKFLKMTDDKFTKYLSEFNATAADVRAECKRRSAPKTSASRWPWVCSRSSWGWAC